MVTEIVLEEALTVIQLLISDLPKAFPAVERFFAAAFAAAQQSRKGVLGHLDRTPALASIIAEEKTLLRNNKVAAEAVLEKMLTVIELLINDSTRERGIPARFLPHITQWLRNTTPQDVAESSTAIFQPLPHSEQHILRQSVAIERLQAYNTSLLCSDKHLNPQNWVKESQAWSSSMSPTDLWQHPVLFRSKSIYSILTYDHHIPSL